MSELARPEWLAPWIMDQLDRMTLTPEQRARLFAVIDNPCAETWRNACSIVIEAGVTLEQAVVSRSPRQEDGAPRQVQILAAITMRNR